MTDSKSFYILLASNSSTALYPNNTLSHFKNALPRSLNFSLDGWKVSLQALALNIKLSTIPYALRNIENPILYWHEEEDAPTSIFSFKTLTYVSFISWATQLRTQLAELSVTDIKVVSKKKKLTLSIQSEAWLAIDVDMCKWLTIKQNPKEEPYYWNGKTYYLFHDESISSTEETFFNPPPHYIKLHLNEMQPHLSDSSYHQILAILPFNRDNNKEHTFYHEVLRREYFAFSSSSLETISIVLTDENDCQLNLLPAQPTFVKLKLTKMNYMSFMLRFRSRACQDVYAANINSNFYTRLPNPIELPTGIWEMALTSVQFPTTFKLAVVVDKGALWMSVKVNGDDAVKMTLPEDAIQDGNRLLSIVNNQFNTHIGGRLKMGNHKRKAYFTLEKGNKMVIHLSPLLAYILGASPSTNEEYAELHLTKEKNKGGFISLIDVKRLIPHSMLLYCDIIKPVMIGDTYAKVLKLIPVGNINTKSQFKIYESQHLDFIPLENNSLTSVHFQLRHSNGEIVLFGDNQSEVLINVVLRRKKY